MFLEDSEKYITVNCIICVLTSYKHHQDVLELKEEELIQLQDEIQETSAVLILTEATEFSADELEGMRHSSRRRKRIISAITSEVKPMKIISDEKLKYDRNCGKCRSSPANQITAFVSVY